MIKVGEMRKVGFSIERLSILTLNNIFHIYLERLRHVDYKNRKSFLF